MNYLLLISPGFLILWPDRDLKSILLIAKNKKGRHAHGLNGMLRTKRTCFVSPLLTPDPALQINPLY